MTTLEIETQNSPPWGLGSISSKSGNANDYMYDDTAGAETYAYVVDTGIRITHNEFDGGRAEWGFNAVNNDNNDNNGHGTCVSLSSFLGFSTPC